VDFERKVFCVMGLPIDAIDMQGAVQRVRQAAFSNTRCFISTPNLNFVVAARTDSAFRASVLHSDLSLPDGMPLVWVARLLGLPIRERVSGAGLFEQLQQHAGPPVSVYFFGGPEGAAEAAARRVNERGGGLRCVGFDAPGFGSIEEMSQPDRIERINRSGAQFVIVALGAKKGQAWIERNRVHLTAPVLCHLGAVLNFAAGTVRRAPRWVQAMGAEWAWRIKEERSLARRYWADGVAFIGMLTRHVLPLAATLRLNRPTPNDLAGAWVSVVEVTGQTTLELKGAWTRQNLAPLRRALHDATTSPASVALDLAAVTHVDCALLGLLMQFSGALGSPAHLSVHNAAARVARIFHHAGAQFVLSPHPQP
jgi:N-acetylglucosaminyldiphosphoundecaprenol N-acetyl-beta-D-mannosaminyltransferase